MTRFLIGDLLTGRRINNLPVVSGNWTDTLNDSGTVSCTVTLRDPDVRALKLAGLASVGKAFLAAVDDTNVLQAGPIWTHSYDRDAQTLQLTAAGMWSYFDHRVLLPVLAGRNPTDPTTDTNFVASTSLQGIARALVAQAQLATNGNVPVILPAEIGGSNTRSYKGADLGFVGSRLRELAGVENGPDIRFSARFTADKLGIEWPLLIGTPTQPQIYSAFDTVFRPTASKTSVSGLKVGVDGTDLAAQTFATGGRSSDQALIAIGSDPTLTSLGYPLLEAVDSSHQTVTEFATVQGYANELALLGRRPLQTWSFTHDTTQAPFLGGVNVGDFARLRLRGDPYIPDGEYRLRITGLGSNEKGAKLDVTLQPEVI